MKRRIVAWTFVLAAACGLAAAAGPPVGIGQVQVEVKEIQRKLGVTTMTEVALMRPRTIRSRMAVLTPVEMP